MKGGRAVEHPLRYVPQTVLAHPETHDARQDNAFIARVLAQPKLWLIGDENGLAT